MPVNKNGFFGNYVVDEAYETQEPIPGEYTVKKTPVFESAVFAPKDLEAYQKYMQMRIFEETVQMHQPKGYELRHSRC